MLVIDNYKYCWVTLLGTDNFCGGVKMLRDSLQRVKSKYPLYVIATNNLSQSSFDFLEQENIPYRVFPYISFFCEGDRNNIWDTSQEQQENCWWNCTFSKIYAFLFTEFEKIIFVDADLEFISNCDNYFDFPIPAAFCSPYSEGMRGGTMLLEPGEKYFFECLNIGSQQGVVNDEVIWWKWFPEFKQKPEHHFPEEDWCCTGELGTGFTQKLIHWDGFEKPWFKKST